MNARKQSASQWINASILTMTTNLCKRIRKNLPKIMRGRYKSRAYVSTHALRGEKERNPDTTLTSDHDGLNCPPRSGIQLVLHRPPASGPASLISRRFKSTAGATGLGLYFIGRQRAARLAWNYDGLNRPPRLADQPAYFSAQYSANRSSSIARRAPATRR